MNRDITIKFDPSDEWWKDALETFWITILDGGSMYWVDKIEHDMLDGMLSKDSLPSLESGEHLFENFRVIVFHGAEETDSRVFSEFVRVRTFDVIYDGIKLVSDDVKLTIMNDGDWDANDIDHIFQLGVFGEVRYG